MLTCYNYENIDTKVLLFLEIMTAQRGMKNRDTKTGRFVTDKEPVDSKPIALRLPRSLEAELREHAGDALAPWIREAIAEKLEREKRQKTA